MVRSTAKAAAPAQTAHTSAASNAPAAVQRGPNAATGEIHCRRCSEMLGEDSYHRPPECVEAAGFVAPRDSMGVNNDGPSGTPAASGPANGSPVGDALFTPGVIIDPLGGEIYEPSDPDYTDQIIDCLERLNEILDRCSAVKSSIRAALAQRREGDLKTCRVAGKRRVVKLEFPSESFEQSILKEAWNSFPQHRDLALKIGTINVGLRDWKKLVGTSGPPDLEAFRDMIARASRGEVGLPTVKIER